MDELLLNCTVEFQSTNEPDNFDTNLTTSTANRPSRQTWMEFCENYAKSIAYDFAQSWFIYLAENSSCSIDEKTISRKFVETFSAHFENEARRICRSSRLLRESAPSNHENQQVRNSMPPLTIHDSDSNSSSEPEFNELRSTARQPKRRPKLLQRFPSLREMKHSLFNANSRTKQFFSVENQISEEVDSRMSKKQRRMPWLKSTTTTSKTVVQIVKESVVRYMGGRELDGKTWEKCRLSLIRTVGGYMLEFYDPPKA